MSRLELWAGPECTVNRVGDRFFDQMARSGHGISPEDVARIADLGATTIRFPILWERVAPRGLRGASWDEIDRGLEACRAHGLAVIAGLVHHGSGPVGTSLLDEGFVEGLAAFADAVAARYPTIEAFTPVNEPLTTARFSGLYGHWYPHRRDAASFLRALLVQIRATAAAMEAVRGRTPGARLVQTEDLGHAHATPPLAHQAGFENLRRWLGLDLLFGRVGPEHPLHRHLLENGVTEAELAVLVGRPCPPDVVGINYYVTSERFLDDRLELHPHVPRGGNGRQVYVDVESVRVLPQGIRGHASMALEAHGRYRRPVAFTEVHLGCAPEERVRWLREAWEGASAAREEGADVRAVTVWAVFGSHDWDSLVTRDAGRYEAGAFDVRGPLPRPTAVAAAARDLATVGRVRHPLGEEDGWWRRDERLFPPFRAASAPPPIGRPVLVTGGGGTLAEALRRACRERGLAHVVLSRSELDVGDRAAVEAAVARHRPWLVVNAAGVSPHAPAAAAASVRRAHVRGPLHLAAACARCGARFLHVSSSAVFSGDKDSAYDEADAVRPRSDFGAWQHAGEVGARDALASTLVIRPGALFGPGDRRSPFARAFERLRRGEPVELGEGDARWSPAYLPEVAHRSLDLAVDGAEGVWHLGSPSPLTLVAWLDLARVVAGLPGELLTAASEPAAAAGPQWAVKSAKTSPLAVLEEALSRFAATAEL